MRPAQDHRLAATIAEVDRLRVQVAQLQLLVFSALAFSVLMRTGIYPPELRSVNIDSDWFYRKLGPALACGIARLWDAFIGSLGALLAYKGGAIGGLIARHRQSDGALVRSWATRSMAMWVMVMLLAYLVVYYLGK